MSSKEGKFGYWERRAVEQDAAMHKALDDPEKAIMRAFLLANAWLTKQADEVYKRYFGDGSYTEAEIETILNQSITQDQLSELLVLIKSEDNKAVKKDMQRLVSAMAAKSRITQAELLRAKVEVVARQIGAIEQQQMDDFYIKAIQDAYNQASAEALIGQSKHDLKLPGNVEAKAKPGGVQFIDPDTDKVVKSVDFTPDKPIREFKRMSTSQVDKVMHMNWLGSNYSKRIWKNTDLLADTLKDLFTAQAMSGMSHRDMQRVLQDKFGVGANYARRLIRTEANFVANQARLKGWKEHGIKEYVLVAVLDFRTSTICRKKDGQHFLVSEAHCDGATGNYPPFHAWCRTVAVANFGEETFVGKHLVNNPLGHSFEMPTGTTYREWEQALVDKYGETNVQRAQAEAKSFSTDLKQYHQYGGLLGKPDFTDFQTFQDMKYRHDSSWAQLEDTIYLKQRLADGSFKNDIRWGKQNNHLPGEHPGSNSQGKSLFYEGVDVEQMYHEYGQTGKVIRNRHGTRTPKEHVSLDFPVGIDNHTGREARGVTIHYSKNGIHLVPWIGEDPDHDG
ncbi:minor capsid protein [Lacticaseibacillus saniviri]